ncbi:hypothetical protein [Corynebacterium kalidii]|uniref:DUF4439 domain-containing protein n=1 Tax=Corynebacterium kalidii TaxID=2931982 RepID=A0A9X1WLG9_9CORY|nr:hypothetical protein [Corynebacterium kalidii]MCJ7859510.1 hypothetical protein [Corynebacterium kalidii]
MHVSPTTSPAATSPATSPAVSTAATTPAPARRPLRRRVVAVGAALAVASGALSACSSEPPRPDESLESLVQQLDALDALDGSPVDGGTELFSDQAEAVGGEIVRQCGTDRDGAPPPDCGVRTLEALADAPSVDEVRSQMLKLIAGVDADNATAPGDDAERDRAVLLTGLHAALATLDDQASGGPAIDDGLIDAGFGDEVSEATATALEPVTDLVNQAVYLSGVVLPEAGPDRSLVTTVGTRMRTVRDTVTPASGVAAEAGYRFAEGATVPTDASSAASALLESVHAVTVSLRRAVGEVSESDRALTAMLCAVAARSEAALEDALGEDPFAVSVRGE